MRPVKVPEEKYAALKEGAETGRILSQGETESIPGIQDAFGYVSQEIQGLRESLVGELEGLKSKAEQEIIAPLEEKLIAVAGPIRSTIITTRKTLESQGEHGPITLDHEVFQSADKRESVQAELAKLQRVILGSVKQLESKKNAKKYADKVKKAAERTMEALVEAQGLSSAAEIDSSFARCINTIITICEQLEGFAERAQGKPEVDFGFNIEQRDQVQVSVVPAEFIREEEIGHETVAVWDTEKMQTAALLKEAIRIVEDLKILRAEKSDSVRGKKTGCVEALRRFAYADRTEGMSVTAVTKFLEKGDDYTAEDLAAAAKAAKEVTLKKTKRSGSPLRGDAMHAVISREEGWRHLGRSLERGIVDIKKKEGGIKAIDAMLRKIEGFCSAQECSSEILDKIVGQRASLKRLGVQVKMHHSIDLEDLANLVGRIMIAEGEDSAVMQAVVQDAETIGTEVSHVPRRRGGISTRTMVIAMAALALLTAVGLVGLPKILGNKAKTAGAQEGKPDAAHVEVPMEHKIALDIKQEILRNDTLLNSLTQQLFNEVISRLRWGHASYVHEKMPTRHEIYMQSSMLWNPEQTDIEIEDLEVTDMLVFAQRMIDAAETPEEKQLVRDLKAIMPETITSGLADSINSMSDTEATLAAEDFETYLEQLGQKHGLELWNYKVVGVPSIDSGGCDRGRPHLLLSIIYSDHENNEYVQVLMPFYGVVGDIRNVEIDTVCAERLDLSDGLSAIAASMQFNTLARSQPFQCDMCVATYLQVQ